MGSCRNRWGSRGTPAQDPSRTALLSSVGLIPVYTERRGCRPRGVDGGGRRKWHWSSRLAPELPCPELSEGSCPAPERGLALHHPLTLHPRLSRRVRGPGGRAVAPSLSCVCGSRGGRGWPVSAGILGTERLLPLPCPPPLSETFEHDCTLVLSGQGSGHLPFLQRSPPSCAASPLGDGRGGCS